MLAKIGNWDVKVLETGNFWLDGGAMMGSVPKVLWKKTNPPDNDNRINKSGETYIYAAFAESPLVNSEGVPCNAR